MALWANSLQEPLHLLLYKCLTLMSQMEEKNNLLPIHKSSPFFLLELLPLTPLPLRVPDAPLDAPHGKSTLEAPPLFLAALGLEKLHGSLSGTGR